MNRNSFLKDLSVCINILARLIVGEYNIMDADPAIPLSLRVRLAIFGVTAAGSFSPQSFGSSDLTILSIPN